MITEEAAKVRLPAQECENSFIAPDLTAVKAKIQLRRCLATPLHYKDERAKRRPHQAAPGTAPNTGSGLGEVT